MKIEKKLYKLSEVSILLNISVTSLWYWIKIGKLKTIKTDTGRTFVPLSEINRILNIEEDKKINKNVVIYCRVSSTINKKNLDTQKERLINYCNAKGYQVNYIVSEIGSGINDNRPKLTKLLKSQDFTKIIVEHKDRLTRFGFNYLEILLNNNGIEIEIVNNVDSEKEDLIQDFVSIITSFCARIYGKRRSKRRTEKIIKDLEKDD